MVPAEDEARALHTHKSDCRARVRRVLVRMRALLVAAIVHRMCIVVAYLRGAKPNATLSVVSNRLRVHPADVVLPPSALCENVYLRSFV